MWPSSQWEQLRGGAIGRFQPLVVSSSARAPGIAQLTGEYAEIRFAAEEGDLDEEMMPVGCEAVFGETEAGDVLLLSIAHRGASWGAFRTARYRANALVLDPPIEDIDSDTVLAVQLHYYGLGQWTGDRWLHDEPIEENGTMVGWQAEVRWRPGTSVPLDDGFTLRFSPGHTVSGPFDRRTLTAPLIITVESDQRRPVGEHLQRLDAVHALLAVAHQTPPLASGGGAKFAASQRDYSPLWERTMISLNPPGETSHDFPHLGIDNVGGHEGVAAWVALTREHRRAVEPVVRHVLFGNQTPEARLLSTASALEYWVASNAGTNAWAKKVKGETVPGALASTSTQRGRPGSATQLSGWNGSGLHTSTSSTSGRHHPTLGRSTPSRSQAAGC